MRVCATGRLADESQAAAPMCPQGSMLAVHLAPGRNSSNDPIIDIKGVPCLLMPPACLPGPSVRAAGSGFAGQVLRAMKPAQLDRIGAAGRRR